MLTSLRHRAVSRATNQNSAVHLSSTSDHVLHVVSVSWAVYVCVMTQSRIVLYVCGRDGDTTLTLFWSVVDLVESLHLAAPGLCTNASQSSSQSSFTVVNVTDGADVYVRLRTLKLFLSHFSLTFLR